MRRIDWACVAAGVVAALTARGALFAPAGSPEYITALAVAIASGLGALWVGFWWLKVIAVARGRAYGVSRGWIEPTRHERRTRLGAVPLAEFASQRVAVPDPVVPDAEPSERELEEWAAKVSPVAAEVPPWRPRPGPGRADRGDADRRDPRRRRGSPHGHLGLRAGRGPVSRQLPRGEGQLPRLRTLEPDPCAGTACGQPVDEFSATDPQVHGWIWAGVNGSRDPACWYLLPTVRSGRHRRAPADGGCVVTGPRIGSLCSGYGGLDLAAMDVLGGTVAWHAQHDPADKRQHAARILAHRWPDVPNHGDITTFPWRAAEPVDVLTAGFPCQPVSHAGRQLGVLDDRWIWPAAATAVRVLRPRLVLLENVAALLVRGLSGVLPTWPRSGTWDLRAAYALPTSEPLTAATGCSSPHGLLLKTPTAQLAVNGGSQHPDKRRAGGHGPTVADEVEHLLRRPGRRKERRGGRTSAAARAT